MLVESTEPEDVLLFNSCSTLLHLAAAAVVVGGHAHGRGGPSTRGPLRAARLRRRQAHEEVIRLVPEVVEDLPSGPLHPRVLKVVAELQPMRPGQGGEVVPSPFIIPLLLAQGLSDLALEVLEQSLHGLLFGCRRVLDATDEAMDHLLRLVQLLQEPGQIAAAVLLQEGDHLVQLSHESQAAVCGCDLLGPIISDAWTTRKSRLDGY